jgi:hypothetical protein
MFSDVITHTILILMIILIIHILLKNVLFRPEESASSKIAKETITNMHMRRFETEDALKKNAHANTVKKVVSWSADTPDYINHMKTAQGEADRSKQMGASIRTKEIEDMHNYIYQEDATSSLTKQLDDSLITHGQTVAHTRSRIDEHMEQNKKVPLPSASGTECGGDLMNGAMGHTRMGSTFKVYENESVLNGGALTNTGITGFDSFHSDYQNL